MLRGAGVAFQVFELVTGSSTPVVNGGDGSKQHRDPVAQEGKHRATVKDFVEAERAGHRVRALECIHDRPRRIEQSAGKDEHHHGDVSVDKINDEHDRCPAHEDINSDVEPAWCVDPENPESDPDDRARPHQDEQQHALMGREGTDSERSIGARNEQADVGVVNALEDVTRTVRPVDAVIQRRGAKQQGRGEQEHGRCPFSGNTLRQHNEDDSGSHRDGEGARVYPAAPARLAFAVVPHSNGLVEQREAWDAITDAHALSVGPFHPRQFVIVGARENP